MNKFTDNQKQILGQLENVDSIMDKLHVLDMWRQEPGITYSEVGEIRTILMNQAQVHNLGDQVLRLEDKVAYLKHGMKDKAKIAKRIEISRKKWAIFAMLSLSLNLLLAYLALL